MEKYENFTIKNVGEKVTINGWVSKVRNLGGVIFIDLRNRVGIVQVVVNPDSKYYELANTLKSEYVIKVYGTIVERVNKNKKLLSGEIEINVETLELINKSKEVPFQIENDTNSLEDTRLKYRYLDLRREVLQNNFILRNKITFAARKFLNNLDFLEVETPVLCKSTPEGARDYLVGEDDIMALGEQLVASIFKETKNIDIKIPLQRMKYNDAISLYGSDKPDLRFKMEIHDLTKIFKDTEFSVFKNVLLNNGIINAIVVKNVANIYSRKDIDKLTDFVKTYKAEGLAYLKFNDEVSGSIAKFLNDVELSSLKEQLNIDFNDLVLVVSGKYKVVKTSLGALRCKLAKDLNLIDKNEFKLLWVVDFPSFEWSEEENRYVACHHPFTMPKDEDVDKLLTDKANCYSKAYDIVINGYEAGGGSIRIHDEKVQEIMFKALELSDEEIREKFGFFVDALKYGCPPHGGFALGLDRLTMLLSGTDNIRDVIAFPKTASATDLMCEAPNSVSSNQLYDLGISINNK